MKIETKRLILRPWEISDAEAIAEAIDYELAKLVNLPWPYNKDSAVEFITTTQDKEYQKDNLTFAIVLKSTNKPIGSCGIHKKERGYSLGIWVASKFQNNVYGAEAMAAVANYGFKSLGIDCYYSNFYEYNEKSKKLQLGGGSKIIDEEKAFVKATGKEETSMVTELRKEDFYKKLEKYKDFFGI